MNDNQANLKNNEASPLTFEQAREIGLEFGELMILATLSKEEEDRLNEILELATFSESVDFWVSLETLNHGTDLGLMAEDALQSYENQKAWLREYLGMHQITKVHVEKIINGLESGLRGQMVEAERKEIKKIFEEAKLSI